LSRKNFKKVKMKLISYHNPFPLAQYNRENAKKNLIYKDDNNAMPINRGLVHMKIEFELPEGYENNDMLFLCSIENPSPIAYCNVYEIGDVWVKKQGCDQCSEKGRSICCRDCAMTTSKGCLLHLEKYNRGSKKPFSCITVPSPEKCMSYCALQFESVKGSKKGKIRKVCNPGNVFE